MELRSCKSELCRHTACTMHAAPNLTSRSRVGSFAGSGMRFKRQTGAGGALAAALPAAELCCWLDGLAGCLAGRAQLMLNKREAFDGDAADGLILPAPPLLRAAALARPFRLKK